MTDDDAFRAAMAAAPDDEAVHKIYADWLDEHDRPEEAAYHRRWTVEVRRAEEWFADLAASSHHDDRYGLSDRNDQAVLTSDQLIDAGRTWLATLDPKWNQGEFFTQSGDDSLRDFMYSRENREEFWRNWALVTGVAVPDGVPEDGNVFSCSC